VIHRLALLMGGAGAAGVLALALSLGGSAPPTTDAFVPVANDVTSGDQLALAPPADTPAQEADPGADQTAPSVKKQVDTIYVLPAPKPDVTHTNKPSGGKDSQPSDTPRPARNDGGGNGGDNVGDGGQGEDEHDGGDHSDDGGSDDGGHEPGDD
jgi:hypothetical protein